MRAALARGGDGADVAIISKVHPVRSHSNAAQGGINAAARRGRLLGRHTPSTRSRAPTTSATRTRIEILCREAAGEVLELEHMGVIFHRDDDGQARHPRLRRRLAGAHLLRRRHHRPGDPARALRAADQARPARLRRVVRHRPRSSRRRLQGAVRWNIRTGQLQRIGAKAVIMATGGAGRVYEPSTNALICTGDGIALAYRAGAPMMDMEMVQFHPTTPEGLRRADHRGRARRGRLPAQRGRRALHGEVRAEHDGAGQPRRRLARRADRDQRGPRRRRLRRSSTCATWAEADPRAPLARSARSASTSPASTSSRSRSRSCPACTTSWAASRRTSTARPSIPGLYAAGETACVSVHGANRLGANSLLDTIVFGRRSGERRRRPRAAENVSLPGRRRARRRGSARR